ncbi:MAG: AAA family ATPase [bacterium]|nr:AAA family ATPase [bacterium]
MASSQSTGPSGSSPLILTKLNPPRTTERVVDRPRLYRWLDQGAELPVVLLSAPAGFGKSTLVASWLKQGARPFAWLSLDQGDRDPRLFLRYLFAALDGVEPGVCPESRALLDVPELPPLETVAGLLANELEALASDLVLVLDDVHRVREPAAHDLLALLIRHAPRRLHLVLLTRADPPLPWPSLKAAGQAVEIRLHDLQFTADEAGAFFRQALGEELEPGAVARLLADTEGWAVGMQLAALSLRRSGDVDGFLHGLRAGDGDATAYLVAEVLDHLDPERREALLDAAVLERFSPSLCEALREGPAGDSGDAFWGRRFVEWLQVENLFVISIDGAGEWYRFHHLFRELLQQELEARREAAHVRRLHRRAARWLEERGFLEEALSHLTVAGGEEPIADLVRRHRVAMMEREEWDRLERCLSRVSAAAVGRDAELLMQQAWICDNRHRYGEMSEWIARAEEALGAGDDDGRPSELRAELDALSAAAYFYQSDARRAELFSRRALENLPAGRRSERGYALAVRIVALQMCGRGEEARAVALSALGDREHRGTTYHCRILIGLCLAGMMEGDTRIVLRYGRELLALGRESGLGESVVYGRYFLGAAHWDRDELEEAEKVLAPVAGQQVPVNLNTHAYSVLLLALVCDARGELDAARELLRELAQRAVGFQNPELIRMAEAFEAELHRRQGLFGRALRWARRQEPDLTSPQWHCFRPALTWIRVMLDSADAVERAAGRRALDRLEQTAAAHHHRRSRLDLRLLSALLALRAGDRSTAVDHLSEAARRARPLGLARPLRDAAPEIGQLLLGLGEEPGPRAPATTEAGQRDADPLDGLSPRELEILELLAERFTNKEVGARLRISSSTVKRHTANIYLKLQVHDRRQAVTRAREMRLLATA